MATACCNPARWTPATFAAETGLGTDTMAIGGTGHFHHTPRWEQASRPQNRVPSPLAAEGQGEGFTANGKGLVLSLWRGRWVAPLPGPPPQGGTEFAPAPSASQLIGRSAGDCSPYMRPPRRPDAELRCERASRSSLAECAEALEIADFR